MSEHRGPMSVACHEIRTAIDDFAAEQRVGRRLTPLLSRIDAMLNELETLNPMQAKRAPASWRSDLTAPSRTCRSSMSLASGLAHRRRKPSRSEPPWQLNPRANRQDNRPF